MTFLQCSIPHHCGQYFQGPSTAISVFVRNWNMFRPIQHNCGFFHSFSFILEEIYYSLKSNVVSYPLTVLKRSKSSYPFILMVTWKILVAAMVFIFILFVFTLQLRPRIVFHACHCRTKKQHKNVFTYKELDSYYRN